MNMKKRFLALVLGIFVLFTPLNGKAKAHTISEESLSIYDTSALTGYQTFIMQGNTELASDCVAFENALEAAGNGYSLFGRVGWTENNNTPSTVRVTETQFKSCRLSHVAYYSGHGGTYWDGNRYPVLNYSSSNSYGTSSPFNVATALGVAGDDWQTACIVKSSDNLRVLFLASCSQLDSNVVKYYARVMKASGVRAIAGYHDIAPSDGDDTIATNFVQYADGGQPILEAWKKANPSSNWAVLVYTDDINDDNQVYYMPGFPGRIYEEPSSSASVYRYANFLSAPREESTASTGVSLMTSIDSLPLTITAVDCQEDVSTQEYSREPVWGNTSVADDNGIAVSALSSELNEDLTSKICVEYNITREEIDTEEGVLAESEVVVERTYNYHDSYNGVKIADSFVSVSIDSEGINNVSVQRKSVVSSGTSVAQLSVTSENNVRLISEQEALKLLYADHSCIFNSELYAVSLAYVPDGSGNHVLCYEFMLSGGFHYVNVATGEIVNVQ